MHNPAYFEIKLIRVLVLLALLLGQTAIATGWSRTELTYRTHGDLGDLGRVFLTEHHAVQHREPEDIHELVSTAHGQSPDRAALLALFLVPGLLVWWKPSWVGLGAWGLAGAGALAYWFLQTWELFNAYSTEPDMIGSVTDTTLVMLFVMGSSTAVMAVVDLVRRFVEPGPSLTTPLARGYSQGRRRDGGGSDLA